MVLATTCSSLVATAPASGVATDVTWNPQVNPMTGTRAEGLLAGESCITAESCVAVGSDVGEPIVVVGNPATWTSQQAHQIALGGPFGTSGSFSSVSCLTVTDCVAVGEDNGPNEYDEFQLIVAVGNPATWGPAQVKQITLGNSFGGGGALNSVACTSDSWCVAVGSDGLGSFQQGVPIVVSGDPRRWRKANVHQIAIPADIDSAAEFSGYGGELLSVSCPAQADCVAVGDSNGDPLSFTGNPLQWTVRHARTIVPRGSQQVGHLEGVSCVSVTQCVATGYENYLGLGNHEPLEIVGNPTTWSWRDARPILLGSRYDSYADLSSVACESATYCVAVGSDNQSNAQPIAIQGNPFTWHAREVHQFATTPSEGRGAQFTSVVCVVQTCDAVGFDNGTEMPQAVQLVGDASSWTDQPLQTIPLSGSAFGAGGDLLSVSCPAPTECVGVGVDSNGAPFSLRGNPAAWTSASAIEMAPPGEFASSVVLSGVSCPTTTECVAVGTDLDNDLIAVVGNPATWGPHQFIRIPLGRRFGNGGQLVAVSCRSVTECVAVGSDFTKHVRYGFGEPIVVQGNPVTWSAARIRQIAVDDAQGLGGQINDVDCTSAHSCTAVGTSNAGQILSLTGDPRRWSASTLTAIPVPGGVGSGGEMSSVSCATSTRCVAVGSNYEDDPLFLMGNPVTWASSPVYRGFVTPAAPGVVTGFGFDGGASLFENPGGVSTLDFSSVSCRGATTCVASGVDANSAPVFVTGNPTTWRLVPVVRPRATPTFNAADMDTTFCVPSACYGAGDSVDGPYVVRL